MHAPPGCGAWRPTRRPRRDCSGSGVPARVRTDAFLREKEAKKQQKTMFRRTFLALSRNRALRGWMETSQIAQRLTRRFVAGEHLDDVLRVSSQLHREGLLSTLDHLGENVSTEAEAIASRQAMEQALQAIRSTGLPSTISIKLTQFGLDLSDDFCRDNVEPLTRLADEMGSRVEIDMEDSSYTERTLRIVEALHARHSCVRCVLQAYLYRSEKDVARMNAARIPVRLCKGAYREPATVAFPQKSQVDENYLKLAHLLLDEGAYPAMATHDPRMIDGVLAHVSTRGYDASRFEFQMLYGVRRDLQKQLVQKGFRVRLYVPYGDAWYPYFMRRLAERPANALFIARNLFKA